MLAFDRSHLIRKTGIVSICRTAGVLSGLILDAVILASFGLGKQTDAFFVALAIPILIDGTLSIQVTQALVPILASLEKESGPNSAWDFLSNVITVWFLVVSVLTCAAMAVAVYVIPLQVPGLDAEAIHMASKLNMLLVWLIPLSGLAAMLQGALLSLHHFWLASSTKALTNICIISVVFSLHRSIGIYSLALGYLGGFAIQSTALWIALWRRGFRYRWSSSCRDPHLRNTIRMVFYPLTGQALGECRTLIENFFASFYAPGVLSALRYAGRIIYALSGVLMGSVVTATTPVVAYYLADKDREGMKSTVRNGVKLLLFMSVPVCVWLAWTGDSLIGLLFERGQFSKADTELTSSLMALMSPYILFSRAISITQTPFYAVRDTKTLVIGMILSFLSYLLLTPPLLYEFGVYGFPLAMVASTALGALIMLLLLRRSFGAMDWGRLRTFSVQLLGASGLASLGLLLGRQPWMHFAMSGWSQKLLAVGVPSLLGIIGFFAGALIFRLIDPAWLPGLLPFGLGKHYARNSQAAESFPKRG